VRAANFCERREFVKIGARGSHDVLDGMAAHRERVSDKGTMAAPGDGFGAHDGAELRVRQFFEASESCSEFGGLHVIGEASKAGIVPASVDGIGARVAKAAEFWKMPVGDVRAANGGGERVASELRIVTGLGNGAHVDEALNLVSFEEGEEIVDGAVGMADGEDERSRRATLRRVHLFIIRRVPRKMQMPTVRFPALSTSRKECANRKIYLKKHCPSHGTS